MTMLPVTAPWISVTSSAGGVAPHPAYADAKTRESRVHWDRVILGPPSGTGKVVDRFARTATSVPARSGPQNAARSAGSARRVVCRSTRRAVSGRPHHKALIVFG